MALVRNFSRVELSSSNLKYNIDHFRRRIAEGTKLLVMVKANAYGHGLEQIACELEKLGVDYLGVAYAGEGAELRMAGVSSPIFVFTPGVDYFREIVDFNLEPALPSVSALNAFRQYVRKRGMRSYPVHIPIDTGMHRVGFMERDMEDLKDFLAREDTLYVKSVYTHLVGSDEQQFDSFTLRQINSFESMYDSICGIIGYRPIKHALNTGGIERFPQYAFDMVRLGIGAYGIKLLPDEDIRPVASLKAKIIQIKELDSADGTVGYSRKGAIEGHRTVATVPLGYADGIDRKFGCGNACFSVNGHQVPTIGNICMDVMMLDITGIDAKEGDMVTIFGEDPRVEELAAKLGTIPYEIVTTINRRVLRLIVK